jgi:hypothetical protein
MCLFSKCAARIVHVLRWYYARAMTCLTRYTDNTHYSDAGAKLSGDRSQSHSDAPLTALAGPLEIPSLRIFEMRVVRLTPSLPAAPFGPPTTQLVSRRVLMMTARCASFSVLTTPSCVSWVVSSAIGARSSLPFVKITDRSIKFCSSRIFPGQSCLMRAAITSSETRSIDLP